MIQDEAEAVIRGIYHNTTFTKWWALELKSTGDASGYSYSITAAVTARFILETTQGFLNVQNPGRRKQHLKSSPKWT